jgi:cell division septation protein DedD
MPFDDEDEPVENQPNPAESLPKRPGPILHTPKSGIDIPFKIVIPIILVIAVGIGGYWYYNTKMKKKTPPPVVVNMAPIDTTQMQSLAVQPEDTAMAKEQPPPAETKKGKVKPGKTVAKLESPKPITEETHPKATLSTTGKYSIVLGSFKSKQNADDLYAHWKAAGYPAFLTTKGAWFKVSIGKYPSIEEAKKEAEKMRDSFKDGYLIEAIE